MAGLGEALNLLGLAAGSDSFGAVLQWGAALARLWSWASPAILVLVPNQKPFMVPLACVLAAAALLLEAAPSGAVLCAAGTLAGFALACKVSFLPEAGLLALLAAARTRASPARRWLLAGLACGAAVAGPLLLRKSLMFGDPLSPVLERFRAVPDPGLIGCVAMVTGFHERSPLQLLLLPLRAIVMLPGGDPTYVLGLGSLAIAAVLSGWRRRPALAALVACSLVAATAFGPFSPRFWLPAYAWAGLAAVEFPPGKARDWWLRGLLAQGAGVAALAVWTAAARARVEAAMTRGFDEAVWLRTAMPPGATLVSPHTSYYRLAAPFRPSARILYALDEPVRRAAFAAALHDAPGVWIAQAPAPPGDLFADAAARCGRPLAAHDTVVARIFRPRGAPVALTLYALDAGRPGCREWLAGAAAAAW